MTFSDSDHDPADDAIRQRLRDLSMPAAPAETARRVQGRLRRRRNLQAAAACFPVVALIAVLLLWRPWVASDPPIPPVPPIAQGNARPLEADELQALFAAPPVDSLAILARRDQVSVAALNRLETQK